MLSIMTPGLDPLLLTLPMVVINKYPLLLLDKLNQWIMGHRC
uniref:Uncharacterized protein n=1 Tax=Picea sitchensis TaxID=3332 RepID=A0A6B9XVL9_PICSI|nr:hypothetical protein Q903MT_gene4275 [Picea sitchensis]